MQPLTTPSMQELECLSYPWIVHVMRNKQRRKRICIFLHQSPVGCPSTIYPTLEEVFRVRWLEDGSSLPRHDYTALLWQHSFSQINVPINQILMSCQVHLFCNGCNYHQNVCISQIQATKRKALQCTYGTILTGLVHIKIRVGDFFFPTIPKFERHG